MVTITPPSLNSNSAVQTIAGTVSDLHAGSMVSSFDNSSPVSLATATVGVGGAWSASVTLPVTGINNLVAKNTNLAGTAAAWPAGSL